MPIDDGVETQIGPFAMLPRWVLRSGLSDGAVRLYAAMADRADRESSELSFSRRTLAADCGVKDVKVISKRIKELEEFGAIRVSREWVAASGHEVNRYLIVQVDPRGVSTPSPSDAPRGESTPTPPSPSNAPTPRGQNATVRRTSLQEPTSTSQVTSGTSPDSETPPPSGGDTEDPMIGFDKFWAVYPKRNGRKGSRAATEAAWRKIPLAQKRLAFKAACHYARHLSAVDEYPKDAERFLKPERGCKVPYYREWIDYDPPPPAELERRNGAPPPPRAGLSWEESSRSGVALTPEQLERLEAEMEGAADAVP